MFEQHVKNSEMGPDCSAVFFFSSPSSGILENLDALCLVISLGGADGAYVYRTAPASLLSCRICIVTYQFAGTRANAPILAIGGSRYFRTYNVLVTDVTP